MAASRSRPSPDLATVVESRLRGWLGGGQHLCIGLSGGRDSIALLHLAVAAAPRLGITLSAVHVDHGLSPNAENWANFCAERCAALGVPFRLARCSVAPVAGEGLEAAARRARYAAFAECTADALALAHHAGDQAETLLFRLLRGSGVAGASGMPASRVLAGAGGRPLRLLRPLLEVAPQAISDYVAQHKLAFVDDESNADPAYTRNFLRHTVLAPIEARFPGAGGRLAQAAGRFGEAAELLAALADLDAQACAGQRGLRLAALGELPPARQRNLLHDWLRRAGVGVPAAAWLEELRQQLLAAGADAQTQVRVGGTTVRSWRGEVLLTASPVAQPLEARIWRGEASLDWAGGELRFDLGGSDGISVARLAGRPVEIRPRHGGERLRPDPQRPRRSLKSWLREAAIPPWERVVLPCLWCGDELVWVAGIGSDAAYAASAGEPAWRVDWTSFRRGP